MPQSDARAGGSTRGIPSQDFLHVLLKHLPALVFVKDAKFRIVAANDRFLALYPEELRDGVIGTTTVEQYDEAQREMFLAKDREAFETGLTEYVETIDFPNGQTRSLLSRKVRFLNHEGEAFIICMSADITDYQRVEARALHLVEVLDASRNEVFVIDAATRHFVDANEGALRNLGHTLASLQRCRLEEVLTDTSEPELHRALDGLAEDLAASLTLHGHQVRMDGTTYPVEWHVRSMIRDGGTVFLAFALDTTELESHRHDLARRNDELLQFAYRSSHDLKAPIVSACGLLNVARIALDEGDLDEARQTIDMARSSLERLVELSEQIVELARLEQVPGAPVPVEVRATIQDARDAIAAAFPEVDVTWGIHVDAPFALEISPGVLPTVLGNLLSNAFKYRDPDRALVIDLNASTDPDPPLLRVRVQDNGRGVPEEGRGRLFSLFCRLHPRQASGSGLGLHLARKAARSAGGDLVHVPTEVGAAFELTLPAGETS